MKTTRKLLSVMLAVLMTTLILAVAVVPAGAWNVGDVIEFGTYPQTMIGETATLRNAANAATWDTYYYAHKDGYIDMNYADFMISGQRYRAVKFSQYRPFSVLSKSNAENSNVDDNGFATNKTYYFRYDPVRWKVLDPNTGLVICEKVIDAQYFSATILLDTSDFGIKAYQDKDRKIYSNDYGKSSLHDFMIGRFTTAAFSVNQKNNMKYTRSINEASVTTDYSYASTNDIVLTPSLNDALNSAYGFSASRNASASRIAYATDYAKCQGAPLGSNGACPWWLRTPAGMTYITQTVKDDGSVYGQEWDTHFAWNLCGVRPMICLTRLLSDAAQTHRLPSANNTLDSNYTEVFVPGEAFENGIVIGTGLYPSGATVTLRAVPDEGVIFDGWYDSWNRFVTADITYTETLSTSYRQFHMRPRFRTSYHITPVASPASAGTVTDPVTVQRGKHAVLEATPAAGYHLIGWYEGEELVSTDLIYDFVPTGDCTVTARFERDVSSYEVVVTVKPAEGGTVTGTGEYPVGSTATLTAVPNPGYKFKGWTLRDQVISKDPVRTVTVDRTIHLTASFAKIKTYICTATAEPAEGGTVTGSGDYNHGERFQFTATPNEGYTFVGWYIGDTKISDNTSSHIMVNNNWNVVARFEKDGAGQGDPGSGDSGTSDPENVCPWCGGQHEGFFQKIVGFFHNILAKLFGAKY